MTPTTAPIEDLLPALRDPVHRLTLTNLQGREDSVFFQALRDRAVTLAKELRADPSPWYLKLRRVKFFLDLETAGIDKTFAPLEKRARQDAVEVLQALVAGLEVVIS